MINHMVLPNGQIISGEPGNVFGFSTIATPARVGMHVRAIMWAENKKAGEDMHFKRNWEWA